MEPPPCWLTYRTAAVSDASSPPTPPGPPPAKPPLPDRGRPKPPLPDRVKPPGGANRRPPGGAKPPRPNPAPPPETPTDALDGPPAGNVLLVAWPSVCAAHAAGAANST